MKVGKYLGEQHQNKEASDFDPYDCSETRSRQASEVAGCENLLVREMKAIMAQQSFRCSLVSSAL